MRVFVAGASGAIGIRFVPQLIDAGHEVIGIGDRAAVGRCQHGRPECGGDGHQGCAYIGTKYLPSMKGTSIDLSKTFTNTFADKANGA